MAVVSEQRTVEQQVVVDVLCDRCGKSCIAERIEAVDRAGAPFEIASTEKATFRADWGYFSDHDGERWDADLCESCAAELKQWLDSGDGAGVRVRRAF